MKFFVALSLAAAVIAAPTLEDAPAVEKRGCYVPPPNQGVIDTALRICNQRKLSDKMKLAVFETMAVESNFNNLECGDKDSLGVFQQRPSMKVWGTREEILNVAHATNAFIDAAVKCNNAHPNYSAGQVAQCAQVSEFPDRYDQLEGRAREQLNAAVKRVGGGGNGGAVNVGKAPSSGSSSSSSGSSSGGCKTWRTAKKGDSCSKLANAGGISLSKFYSLNKSVNNKCTNLQVNKSYCIAQGSSAPAKAVNNSKATTSNVKAPGNLAKGTTSSCKKYTTVKSGSTCSKLASGGGISLSKFYSLNKGVNSSSCNNLQVGKAYCVSA